MGFELNKPISITIHHSASKDHETLDWGGLVRYHVDFRRYLDVGYHYGIERFNGKPKLNFGRAPWQNGAHCPGINRKSLGVVFVGNFMDQELDKSLLIMGVELCTSLCVSFNIHPKNIYGHREMSRRPTACPGRNFPLDKLKKYVLSSWEVKYKGD